MSLLLVIVIIILAWTYDFWNGVNDRANAIATTISTKAFSFSQAVILSAIFNFLGALVSTEVAKTIGRGIIASDFISLELLIFALIGAISWTILSTHYGLPISVTHSLIGGLIGSALVKDGISVLIFSGIKKVLFGMIFAPIIGFFTSAIFLLAIVWLIKIFVRASPFRIQGFFRNIQRLTTALVSFGHGLNDTQNAMGIITISLVSAGFLSSFIVPLWVKIGSGIFMALGTLYAGQKVIKTIGQKIYKILPVHGCATESASSFLIILKSLFGIPLSTTQVIAAGVMGVGAIERKALVNWRKVIEIFFSWIFTIPGAALISGILFFLFKIIFF
jgi:PiT family inorganic phosphate transporter